MASTAHLVDALERRRHDLRMSRAALAARSGLSLPTVQRILSGMQTRLSYSSAAALAQALGARLDLAVEVDAQEFLRQQAREKAERLVGMVQGSAALEGQGLDAKTRERMIEQTVHELLAGSRRKLWAA